ncbi:MAG: Hsp33 family molecular chaperone [Micropepsaceae bacterium]
MTRNDFVRSFQIEGMNVRGRIVHLTDAADQVIAAHGYPATVSRVVGEALALAALLGASLKFNGTLTVQTRSDGPLRMIVADFRSPGDIRACATFDREAVEMLGPRPSFKALVGNGSIAITIDPETDMERYQGVVPLEGDGIADGAIHYFDQSEQIPTSIKLSVATLNVRGPNGPQAHWRAGGILIQNLATLGGIQVQPCPDDDRNHEDDWPRASALFSTVEPHELVDPLVEPERLLFRLFHEDGVRVFDVKPLRFACRCSSERVSDVLRQYSEIELNELADQDGLIRAKCEFCSATYSFAPDTLRQVSA